MRVGYFGHSREALGVEPIVGVDNLEITGLIMNGPDGPILIRGGVDELRCMYHTDARIACSELIGDCARAVRADVVVDDVLPVPACLAQHTLDALREEFRAVVYG